MNRFDLMVLQLQGLPTPPIPAVPGRAHHQPPVTDVDPVAEQWEALEQRTHPGGLTSSGPGLFRNRT
jgi:hypothetical protein